MTDDAPQDTTSPEPPPLAEILVATDFSPSADRALERAVGLANEHNARLTVIHAVEWLDTWWSPMTQSPDFLDKLRREGQARLEKALETIGSAPERLEFKIDFDAASQVILDTAEKGAHDLIVVGTRGLHGAKRLLLGSTAERVLERAQIPVLTIPPPDESSPEPAVGEDAEDRPPRILLPTDLSLDFEAPLEAALRLRLPSSDRKVEIILVHAVDLPSRYDGLVESWKDFVDGTVETVREHVEEGSEELCAEGLDAWAIVAPAKPAELILQLAKSESVSLIAMNAHSSVPHREPHFGSVAKRVVQRAPCPVLVTPRD